MCQWVCQTATVPEHIDPATGRPCRGRGWHARATQEPERPATVEKSGSLNADQLIGKSLGESMASDGSLDFDV